MLLARNLIYELPFVRRSSSGSLAKFAGLSS